MKSSNNNTLTVIEILGFLDLTQKKLMLPTPDFRKREINVGTTVKNHVNIIRHLFKD